MQARFVFGVVEVSPEMFASAVGDFKDAKNAAQFAADSGLPLALHEDTSGKLIGVVLAHVWVEAGPGWIRSTPR